MVDRQPTTSDRDLWSPESRKQNPNLIVEVGAGGVDTAIASKNRPYLEKKAARLLLIDNDPACILFSPSSDNLLRLFNLSDRVKCILGELSDVSEPVLEMWIRNILTDPNMAHSALRQELYNQIKERLTISGSVMFIETYFPVEKELKDISQEIAIAFEGYEIQPIDLDRDEHPYVEIYRKLDPAYTDPDSPKLALRISRVNRSDNG